MNSLSTTRLTKLIAIVYVVLGGFAAYTNSPTVDEPGFMAAGLTHWATGQFEPYAVNPPLVRLMATFPVQFIAKPFPTSPLGGVFSRPESTLAEAYVTAQGDRLQWQFFIARLICLIVNAGGLLIASRWAATLFGPNSGVFAALMWCFSPMMLGHGSLITADGGAATCGVLAFWILRHWLIRGDIVSAGFMGVCTSLAILSKSTWIVVLPICFAMIWLLHRIQQRQLVTRIPSDALQISIAVCVCIFFINANYGFDRTGTRLGEIQFISNKLSPRSEQSAICVNRFSETAIGRLPIPLPPLLFQGIDLQRTSFESINSSESYLMGTWKNGGWWYYYLVGILLKSPIGSLGLIAIAAIRTVHFEAVRRLGESISVPFEASTNHGCVSRITELMLLLSPLIGILWLVGSETGFNRHLRYILPAYPFGIILVASVAQIKTVTLKLVRDCLLCLQIISVLWAGPHWLSYFNELSGGPKRGGQWMLGSNVDWGQDLYLLRKWIHSHPDAQPMNVAICSGLQVDFVGLNYDSFLTKERVESKTPGWYAVSVNSLRGQQYGSQTLASFERFRTLEPYLWIGYSVCLFHVPEEDAKIREAKHDESN